MKRTDKDVCILAFKNLDYKYFDSFKACCEIADTIKDFERYQDEAADNIEGSLDIIKELGLITENEKFRLYNDAITKYEKAKYKYIRDWAIKDLDFYERHYPDD